MAYFPRCVVALALSCACAVPALGQPGLAANAASAPAVVRQAVPAEVPSGSVFFRNFGIGTYESPLGFGGRVATSLTRGLVLRAGGSYFSFSTNQTSNGIPFTATIVLQSEEAQVDWYPFHTGFHLSPGVQFGNSSRLYGNAFIPAGNSFTLNGTNYYSGAAGPVQASGSARFRHTSPMLTLGWGSWVRRNARQGHWAFPFELGAVYNEAPATTLNFSGVVCADAAQVDCENVANDPGVQANIQAERVKMHNNANYIRFYPIISGGIVFRFGAH